MQVGTAELDAVKEAAEDETSDLAASLADKVAELAASQAELASLRVRLLATRRRVCSRPSPDCT